MHARIAREVQIDVALRRGARDAQLARQAKGRHAVDQPEVDRLGGAALIGGHLIERHAEDFRRGGLVNVAILGEGPQQAFIAREVRHDAQFDLRVVGRQQAMAGCAMKAWRIRRPSGLRIGMFCRFGSVEDSRPVAATAW